MNEPSRLVPEGISHEPDLSTLPASDRMKYHTRQLRSICINEGANGVKQYKAAFPEAAGILIHSTPVAYQPKPRGYADALAAIVSGWFETDTALSCTNRADVERLNARLETRRFDPDRHFSTKLSKPVLDKLEAVFTQHGAKLDRAKHTTMSKVRRAVQEAKAGRLGEAAAPALIRSGNSVRIGKSSFPVALHCGHDCIRLAVNGKRVRLRLDAVAELIELSELGVSGDPELSTIYSIREPVRDGESRSSAVQLGPAPTGTDDPLANPHDLSPAEPVLFSMPDALGDKLRELRATSPYTSSNTGGPDPLISAFKQGQE